MRVLTVLLFFIAAPIVYGAGASIEFAMPAERKLAPGSEFTVWVTLTNEVQVNAFDLAFRYPATLELIGFDTSPAADVVWYESPRVTPERRVELIGGMTVPRAGARAQLLGIEFRAGQEGIAEFTWERTVLYAADGKGTALADVRGAAGALTIAPDAPRLALRAHTDATPPVVAMEVAHANRTPLLAFHAEDSESGIAATLVRTREWFTWGPWRAVRNPFVLPPGAWAAELLAINGGGQEVSSVVYIGSGAVRVIGLALGLLTVLGTAWVVYNKRK